MTSQAITNSKMWWYTILKAAVLGTLSEPPHDKTNKMTVCLWSESSLSARRKLGSLTTHWAHSGCPGWSESSLGAHAILLILSWGGSYVLQVLLYIRIRPVWSEASLSAWRNIGPLTTYWAHAQDGLSLRWAHRSFCWFCRAAAHIIFSPLYYTCKI